MRHTLSGVTAGCVDVDPHTLCMDEQMSRSLGGTFCSHKRNGSTTLKSAVTGKRKKDSNPPRLAG
jgi:hypothetical protein